MPDNMSSYSRRNSDNMSETGSNNDTSFQNKSFQKSTNGKKIDNKKIIPSKKLPELKLIINGEGRLSNQTFSSDEDMQFPPIKKLLGNANESYTKNIKKKPGK